MKNIKMVYENPFGPMNARLMMGRDPLSGIDIAMEYRLIQQKKSKLSSVKRRMVVARHERTQTAQAE